MNPLVKPITYLIVYVIAAGAIAIFCVIFYGIAIFFGWDPERTLIAALVGCVFQLLNPTKSARNALTEHGIW